MKWDYSIWDFPDKPDSLEKQYTYYRNLEGRGKRDFTWLGFFEVVLGALVGYFAGTAFIAIGYAVYQLFF